MAPSVRAPSRALGSKAGFCLLFLGLTCLSCAPVDRVSYGSSLEIHLAAGETERYRLSVAQGTVVHISAQQRGLDLSLSIDDGPEVDSPYGDRVVEELWWAADESRSVDIEIRAVAGDGEANIRFDVSDRGKDFSRRYWQAHAARADLEQGLVDDAKRDLKQALEGPSPPNWRAITLDALAEAERRSGDLPAAVALLGEAVELLRDRSHQALKSRLLLHRSRRHRDLGELEAAEVDARAAGLAAMYGHDLYGRALAMNFGALNYDSRGELAEAIAGYSMAAEWFGQVGAPLDRVHVRMNHARCLMKLGAMDEARTTFEEIQTSVGQFDGEESSELQAQIYRALGWWHHLSDENESARELLEASLQLLPDHIGALDRLATVNLALGDLEHARRLYQRVAEAVADHPFWRSQLDGNLCRLELAAEDFERAYGYCHGALAELERAGALGSVAQVLQLLGQLEIRRQRLAAAEDYLRRSVDTIEAQRRAGDFSDLLPYFLAERLDSYRLLIQVRMTLHRQEPGMGWDQKALKVFELTRARRLRDLLAIEGAQSDILPPPKVETLESLRSLLDEDSAFAFYHLSEDESFLWWLSLEGLASYSLPPRSEIEPLIESWYELLSDPISNGPWSTPLEESRAASLSRILIEPLAAHLRSSQRLIFVVDGQLQRLPFGALPSPENSASKNPAPEPTPRPLIADHEIVNLPSASVLSLLRRMTAGRPVAPGHIALIVDPVYGPRDERLGSSHGGQPAVSRSGDLHDPSYARLFGAGEEALAIMALMPDDSSLLLDGFDASCERVLSGVLGDYRILHFATHAETGGQAPFGLVLSQITPDGQAVDGMLGLQELYRMELPAELAVLSACGTGLGEDLEGEGLISLTRGFMNAGTPRVLISLWSVEDRATRQLMARFYAGLAGECLSPAAALRQAQVAGWLSGSAKHQWAPFQLQGDWDSFPFCADSRNRSEHVAER